MATPTFINIGPGRCATSWLFEVFRAHPEISMSTVKETEYFNTLHHKGDNWYESHFEDGDHAAIGEISNNYYLDPEVATRVHAYRPDMKLIINVRDPFALMQSFHGFGVRRGQEMKGLGQSLGEPIGRLMGSGYDFRARKNQLTTGDQFTLLESVMLADRVKPFLETFDASQVYVFVYERLKTEKPKVLAEIYEFLGVDSAFVPPVSDKVVNASIEPKSKWVARLVTNVSFRMRQFGLNGLLTRLHRSNLIKQILFRKSADKKTDRVDPRAVVGADASRALNAQIEWLKSNVPTIGSAWDHLDAGTASTSTESPNQTASVLEGETGA